MKASVIVCTHADGLAVILADEPSDPAEVLARLLGGSAALAAALTDKISAARWSTAVVAERAGDVADVAHALERAIVSLNATMAHTQRSTGVA